MTKKAKKVIHVPPMKNPRNANLQIKIKDDLDKDKKIKPEKVFEGYSKKKIIHRR